MTHHNHCDSWFLAQLKPNCAAIAERNLKRQGFSIFLPMEEYTHKRRGRFVSALRPVFPGYIFVSFDVSHGVWRKVHSTYGITRLVCFGQEPAAVPTDIVSQLMRRCDASGKLLPSIVLEPDDEVRLTTGPFVNFTATIEKIAPDRRVWILMDMMGGQTRTMVNEDQLRAV